MLALPRLTKLRANFASSWNFFPYAEMRASVSRMTTNTTLYIAKRRSTPDTCRENSHRTEQRKSGSGWERLSISSKSFGSFSLFLKVRPEGQRVCRLGSSDERKQVCFFTSSQMTKISSSSGSETVRLRNCCRLPQKLAEILKGIPPRLQRFSANRTFGRWRNRKENLRENSTLMQLTESTLC